MIFDTSSCNPYKNLAVEEYLLSNVTEPTLYLWQNDNTVVIGRHQNPWNELNVSSFESDGGKIVRRLSGGGTVFHDLGNLNFTFLMPIDKYNTEETTCVILRAMHRLYIPAEKTGRNDLTVEGRKFSGNAFCVKKQGAYHHGTILLSSDTTKMEKYLTVDTEKIRSKGIKSVRSRVLNLQEYRSDLTIQDVKEALYVSFLDTFGGSDTVLNADNLPSEHISPLYDKYSSWDWIFGQSPKFDVVFTKRFLWGGITIGFATADGRICETSITTDAMDTNLGDCIPQLLHNVEYNGKSISDKLCSQHNVSCSMELNDIGTWLKDVL